MFAPEALQACTITPDRMLGATAGYEHALMASFDGATKDIGRTLTLIGFSLGAMAALHVAARRPDKVERILLASPAAPLQGGDFLPAMAGRVVFSAAQKGDWPLHLLGIGQRALFALNWKALRSQMLKGVSPAERDLLESSTGSEALREGLRRCLGPRHAAYRVELRTYVRPWTDVISAVTQPVDIWIGDEDRWTPPAMALSLHHQLSPRAELKRCPGLGHYSTLTRMLANLATLSPAAA